MDISDTPLARALERARALGYETDADFCRLMNISPQRLNNWKNRRLPPDRHEEVAAKLNWTVEELLGHDPRPASDEWPFPGVPRARFERSLELGDEFLLRGLRGCDVGA